MDRIPSCVSLPLRDDCSTDVPGDTFFFPVFPLSLVLSVAAIFSELYELVTSLFFFFPFLTSSLFFSHISPGANSTPASRQSLHLSVHLSVQPWDKKKNKQKIHKIKLQKKKNTLLYYIYLYIYIYIYINIDIYLCRY